MNQAHRKIQDALLDGWLIPLLIYLVFVSLIIFYLIIYLLVYLSICWLVKSHIWMSHVTHMNESCQTYEWVVSHIWIVGSFKLQVSFAKEPYKRDFILQKRRLIWRSLLIEAIPYYIYYEHVFYRALLQKRHLILRSLLIEAKAY